MIFAQITLCCLLTEQIMNLASFNLNEWFDVLYMSQWLTISIIIQKLNKLKKIYSFNKWLTQFNHYFFFIKRDSDNKFVNIGAMSTTCIWLWFFFLFNTEPDSVKLTAEGDLTYFYKQEEVNNSSINLTFLNVFISVVFFFLQSMNTLLC